MLSYQHGFHAGNFADVHKHLVLTLILQSLNRKSKPWSYLETHSGRGLYELDSEQALKTEEFQQGIAALWTADPGSKLAFYLEQVRAVNPHGNLDCYPGSPKIAALMARENDQLHLMELHPQEVGYLKRNFRNQPQVGVHQRDGYEGVLSLLPPKPNRGVVLVDPSYEVKSEYQQVSQFVRKALALWPNGCFVVWYPLLQADRWKSMVKQLTDAAGDRAVLDSQMTVSKPEERGMYGSGMLIINPPWQLDRQLAELVPEALGQLQVSDPDSALSWLREPA